jgi:hypothetical protein
VRVRVNDPHGGRAVAEASVMVDGAAPVIGHLRRGARVLAVKWPPRRRKTSRGQGRPRRPAAKRPRAVGERPRAARAAAPRRPWAARAAAPRRRWAARAAAPRRPRAARAAAPKRRRPPPRATTVRFSLTEPATVALVVERARRGRRSVTSAPCNLRARAGRRCLVWSRVRSISHAGAAGENAIRLRSRGLRPGLHRLVMTAVDGVGNTSATRMAPLRVVPKRKKPARAAA